MDSDLVNNESYSVNITTTKDDGEVHSIGTVRFSESLIEYFLLIIINKINTLCIDAWLFMYVYIKFRYI